MYQVILLPNIQTRFFKDKPRIVFKNIIITFISISVVIIIVIIINIITVVVIVTYFPY